MSFIQFESAREKEKIRKELREAREQMLEKAKNNAEQRVQRHTEKVLRGEDKWVLPAVAAKIERMSKMDRVSKKSKKKDKKKKLKVKKSKKKSSSKKKKRRSSSTSDSGSSDSEDSSSEEELVSRKKKRKKKAKSSSNSASEESENEADEWIERPSNIVPQKTEESLQRDSWMTDALMLKTFSRERAEKKVNEKQQLDAYDPAKSSRELNPYWKSTGTGLPGFQKPKIYSDDEQDSQTLKSRQTNLSSSSTRSWQKNTSRSNPQKDRELLPSSTSSSSTESESENEKNTTTQQSSDFLTNQQMNELGAKILKAEIIGNMNLAKELKEKLERARTNRANVKAGHTKDSSSIKGKQIESKDEHILLTRTDGRGNCRPLVQSKNTVPTDPRDLYGGRNGRRKQHKRVETHIDGERVRYFPDDDKYDIKQMFEREKYTSAGDNNLQFANIASKHKNPNDDLDDIFADKIRHDQSKVDENRKELQSAIQEQQTISKQLDNCDKCFDSGKMDKKLLVAMGEKTYLALPWHVGLQRGHCVIAPLQHVSCSTQLDEDTWEEISNFRKALTRMFGEQHKDVIFFEIANNLHRRPHLTIHCVPIPDRDGEMAPFYFKKAIEESEHEWSVNKQLVSLRQKGLRQSIPKGLDYFWVNFGMETGFAHVIEDQNRFPSNFATEIIGGMLHLDANTWRRPKKEQNTIAKVKLFADSWKKFDFTS